MLYSASFTGAILEEWLVLVSSLYLKYKNPKKTTPNRKENVHIGGKMYFVKDNNCEHTTRLRDTRRYVQCAPSKTMFW